MKKTAAVLLILALGIIGGCSGNIDDYFGGSGEILGTIENLNTDLGQILPVQVMVIEENPTEDDFDPDNMTIIAETTVENDDSTYETYSYNLNNIPAGEYYVVAFKDLNGNDEIDFSEDGPIDAGGCYGMSEEAEDVEKVVVSKGETVSAIDFPIISMGDTNFFNLEGTVIDLNESRIENVKIELYGTAGIKVYESIFSDSEGNFDIDGGHSNSIGIVDGEYYIKASLPDSNYLNSVTPYFVQETTPNSTTPPTTSRIYWSINGEENDDVLIGSWELPTIMMITQEEAENYGYTAGTSFIGGDAGGAGSEVIITPESGDIGYLNSEGLAEYDLESSLGNGYVIKNVEPGFYTISAEHETSDFYEFKLNIEEDEFSILYVTEIQ